MRNQTVRRARSGCRAGNRGSRLRAALSGLGALVTGSVSVAVFASMPGSGIEVDSREFGAPTAAQSSSRAVPIAIPDGIELLDIAYALSCSNGEAWEMSIPLESRERAGDERADARLYLPQLESMPEPGEYCTERLLVRFMRDDAEFAQEEAFMVVWAADERGELRLSSLDEVLANTRRELASRGRESTDGGGLVPVPTVSPTGTEAVHGEELTDEAHQGVPYNEYGATIDAQDERGTP